MSKPASAIKGVCPVIATPFTESGEVDYEDLDKLTGHLAASGADGAVMFGFASEFMKLEDGERVKMAEIFINGLKGTDMYAMTSVTHHSLEIAVKHAKKYEAMGADCLMMLPPFAISPSMAAIKKHMYSILDVVNIPVLVQYAPSVTGSVIEVDDLADITRINPNALFKIEEKPPMECISSLIKQLPDVNIFVGFAGLDMIDSYAVGATAVMPGCSFTEIYAAITNHYFAGFEAEARAIYNKLEKYITRWMGHVEYIIGVEKNILHRRGIIKSNYCRQPFYEYNEEEENAVIDRFMEEFAEFLPIYK